jgi:hypothetical protein
MFEGPSPRSFRSSGTRRVCLPSGRSSALMTVKFTLSQTHSSQKRPLQNTHLKTRASPARAAAFSRAGSGDGRCAIGVHVFLTTGIKQRQRIKRPLKPGTPAQTSSSAPGRNKSQTPVRKTCGSAGPSLTRINATAPGRLPPGFGHWRGRWQPPRKSVLLCAAFLYYYQQVTGIFSSNLRVFQHLSVATALICHEAGPMGRGLTREICTFADCHKG